MLYYVKKRPYIMAGRGFQHGPMNCLRQIYLNLVTNNNDGNISLVELAYYCLENIFHVVIYFQWSKSNKLGRMCSHELEY